MALIQSPRMSLLGRIRRLVILRESDHGMYLDAGQLGEVLLPTREVPAEVEPGDEVTVFVARDSEDRIVATTRLPYAQAGEIRGLRVIEVNRRLGAFLDFGLAKDLLLPFAEQSKPVNPGETVVVRILVDPKTDRLIASSKLGRYLDKTPPRYERGEVVSLIILEQTPLGHTAVVEGRHRGLIHASDVHRRLLPGDELRGFVREVKDDYKIDLTLDPVGYGRVTDLSQRILEALKEEGGRIEIGDESSPEAIRARFGASKKAFKAAVGSLYRKRLVEPGPASLRLIPPHRTTRGDSSSRL